MASHNRDKALQTDEVKLEAVKKHDPLRYLSYLRLSSIIPGTHGLLRHQEEEEEGLIEEEQPEKEEVLFNLAQNITASHFDFASCEIEGEITKREAEDTISIEGKFALFSYLQRITRIGERCLEYFETKILLLFVVVLCCVKGSMAWR